MQFHGMILAPLRDPLLLRSVRRAALPTEDVFSEPKDVWAALELGCARVAVLAAGPMGNVERAIRSHGPDLPILELASPDVHALRKSEFPVAIRGIDDAPPRMRQLINQAALPMEWVEGVLRDLSQAAGARLPLELASLVRRSLEFPSRYSRLETVAGSVGLSAGALKARFRRRGLPSPFAYMAWTRALCATELLARPGATTTTVAFRLGYASSGNLCRALRTLTGLKPTEAGSVEGRTRILTRFSADFLERRQLRAWEDLGELFATVA